jgi:hypothetical protein
VYSSNSHRDGKEVSMNGSSPSHPEDSPPDMLRLAFGIDARG